MATTGSLFRKIKSLAVGCKDSGHVGVSTEMANEVRICLLKGLSGALEAQPAQLTATNSPVPTYTGPLSKAANLFVYLLFGNDRLNYTLTMKTSIGILNATSGYYDEESCLYTMQTNQSDLAVGATPWYPIEAKNLKGHPYYIAEVVRMLSRYIVLTQTYDSDVMGVFAYVFTPGVWMNVALSCFVFWLVTKMYIHIRNKLNPSERIRDDSLYEVLTHLFQVETIDYTGACMKVLSLFASVLSFVIIVYFTCSMKTDIVVVQQPDFINNYDDLLTKPNIRLIFGGLGDIVSKFESAEPQSKERRAYERSLKNVGGDKNKMIVHSAGMDILQMFHLIIEVGTEKNRRTVAPVVATQIKMASNLGCFFKVLFTRSGDAAKKQVMNYYIWISQDPNAKEEILTLAYSAFYQSPYLAKIQKRMKRIVEMGLNSMWDRFNDVVPIDDKIKNQEEGDIYRNCKANDYRQNLPHVECSPFTPVQFKVLVITCGVLLVLSVVAMVREKYRKRPKHPRFGHNKVAVAGSSGVADQVRQSQQSGRNDAPFGRVATATEVFDQERQNALKVNSRTEMGPSMKLFYKRSNPKQEFQVELPLNTTATEVVDQRVRQDTLNVQARVEVTPSMKFANRRGGQKVKCEVELTQSTSAKTRGVFGRKDHSARSSRKVVPSQHINVGTEIEIFRPRT